MSIQPRKIVIVGGVAGGANTAARARRRSEASEIILLERGPFVSFANCGLPYYVGGEIAERRKLLVHTPESLKSRFNLDVRVNSEVTSIHPTEKVLRIHDGIRNVEYEESFDELVLAPGAAAIRLNVPGGDLPQVIPVRTIPDVDRIVESLVPWTGKRAIVLGGGFIGLEMAEQLHHRGVHVSVVQGSTQVFAPFDPEMAEIIHRELVSKGVDLRLNRTIAEIKPADAPDQAPVEVNLNDGTSLSADVVISAIGVRPDIGFLAGSGVELGATGGIRVDEYLRTSRPGIWAVGDAIEVTNSASGKPALIPLAGPANRQGRMVADNIFGDKKRYPGTWGTAILRIFSLTAAATGLNERSLRAAGVDYQAIHLHSNSHAGYFPGAKSIALKLLFSPKTRRILGAQLAGEDAVDKRLDVISTAMQLNATVDQLAQLELGYAPPYGSAKDPVNLAGMVAENILNGLVTTRQWHEVDRLGGDVLILDVRDQAERANGAIPGSVAIPLPELRSRLSELPREKEILVFCQSGQRSYYATRILTQNGFRAMNLSGAYRTWSTTQENRAERSLPTQPPPAAV